MSALACDARPGERLAYGEPPADAEWPAQATLPARRITDGGAVDSLECLVEEVPVALVYNGISHAVMLASPTDLEDFALGFSLCEGIVASPREIYGIELAHGPLGIEARIELATERFIGLKARRRSLVGRTGCGLCGVDSLEAATRAVTPVRATPRIAPDAILRAVDALPAHQRLHRATGAAHGAAWAAPDGRLLALREDVGRHNALDKLIGALLRDGIAPDTGFAVVTSRASYEMVQKLATFGGGLLAAVSAPTAYAVRLAQASGIALAGFARAGRLTFYSNPQG